MVCRMDKEPRITILKHTERQTTAMKQCVQEDSSLIAACAPIAQTALQATSRRHLKARVKACLLAVTSLPGRLRQLVQGIRHSYACEDNLPKKL